MAYRFIEENKKEFGVRWLLKRLKIYPNAYYNYLKYKKAEAEARRQKAYEEIKHIYHEQGGIPGHRMMRSYLQRRKIFLSKQTVHIYMNKDLGLKSIVRRRKPNYSYGRPHKVFGNLLAQKFKVEKKNSVWCTDFTYMYFGSGEIRYNCTIIDLYDRSVVASENGKFINTELAIRTLTKAIRSSHCLPTGLMLHSDQGSQFTSKEFIEFCRQKGIIQSMSHAGYPLDNAPMERYYNTLKNELLKQHHYSTEEELYLAVQEFAYIWYNQIRPHSYNGYLTPYEKRLGKKARKQRW